MCERTILGCQNCRGNSRAFFQAVREDDTDTVELLAPLFDLNQDFPGTHMNALAAAAHYGSTQVFKYLLKTLHVEADLPDQE